MLGALTGLGVCLIATGVFPTMSGADLALCAGGGMGAVGGKPFWPRQFHDVDVFELTGDLATGLAVMALVSMSTGWRHVSGAPQLLFHPDGGGVYFTLRLVHRLYFGCGCQWVGAFMRRPDDSCVPRTRNLLGTIGEGTY